MVKRPERILVDHIWTLPHKSDFISCDQHVFVWFVLTLHGYKNDCMTGPQIKKKSLWTWCTLTSRKPSTEFLINAGYITYLSGPILQFCSSAWNICSAKDIDSFIKVQKRCCNMTSDNESHVCFSIVTCIHWKRENNSRFVWGLQISPRSLPGWDKTEFFEFNDSNTRGHPLRKLSFSNRVVNSWTKCQSMLYVSPLRAWLW